MPRPLIIVLVAIFSLLTAGLAGFIFFVLPRVRTWLDELEPAPEPLPGESLADTFERAAKAAHVFTELIEKLGQADDDKAKLALVVEMGDCIHYSKEAIQVLGFFETHRSQLDAFYQMEMSGHATEKAKADMVWSNVWDYEIVVQGEGEE